jgi:outer membrane protein assembly factor BamB
MKVSTLSSAFTAVALLGIGAAAHQGGASASAPRPGIDWPAFRGIDGGGIAEGRPTPTTFAPASAVWRTRIPGLGNSSPIVWGDQLCVTTALGGQDATFKPGLYGDVAPVNDDSVHEWKVMCLDKAAGKLRWEQTVHKGVPAVKRHTKSTQANATLATDGAHLAAMFGSEGLHVYDLSGQKLWSKSFGVLDSGWFTAPEAQWGFASSPVIQDGLLVIQADVQKGSFLAGSRSTRGRRSGESPVMTCRPGGRRRSSTSMDASRWSSTARSTPAVTTS